MITTELKDKVLAHLIHNQKDLDVVITSSTPLGMPPSYIFAIVKDLYDRRMLTTTEISHGRLICHLTVKIFDFYKAGGYEFEDHILEGNIMKLKMEIESLEANIGKPQFDKMMSLVMGAIGGFSLVSGKVA